MRRANKIVLYASGEPTISSKLKALNAFSSNIADEMINKAIMAIKKDAVFVSVATVKLLRFIQARRKNKWLAEMSRLTPNPKKMPCNKSIGFS